MSNDAAISMYKLEGYQNYDIWKRYYDDGEDALIMEKILHPDAL
jgi:ribosomal protein S18 acetylase RimI-like enzyme